MKNIIIAVVPGVAASSFEKSLSGFDAENLAAYDSSFVSYSHVQPVPEASCFNDPLTQEVLARTDANAHLCGVKCAPGNNCFGHEAHGCYCSAADGDGSDSPFLCADQATLESLCTSIESCYAVNMDAKRANRGFLSGYGCHSSRASTHWHDVTGELYNTYIKEIGSLDNSECLLGQGIMLSGGQYPDMQGLYQDMSVLNSGSGTGYVQMDSKSLDKRGHYRVVPHHSGCGWSVERATNRVPVAPTSVVPEVKDMPVAANALFGLAGDHYTASICSIAAAAGFCTSPLMAMQCPDTCDVSAATAFADNDDAARELLHLLGVVDDACTDCNSASVDVFGDNECGAAGNRLKLEMSLQGDVTCSCKYFEGHSDVCGVPFVSGACPVSCVGADLSRRRLSHDENMIFTKRSRDFFKKMEADTSVRHLGHYTADLIQWVEVLRGLTPDSCANTNPWQETVWQDVQKWYDQRDITVEGSCSLIQPYGSIPGKYCQNANIIVAYSEHADLMDNQCYRKCSKHFAPSERGRTPDPLYNNPNYAANSGSYCEGNDPDFTEFSEALCLGRQECERICTEMGDECLGFDMHATLPRCYLNAARPAGESSGHGDSWGCASDVIDSNEYVFVVKPRQPYGVERQSYANTAGTALADLTGAIGFPFVSSSSSTITSSGNFQGFAGVSADYAGRVSGLFVAPLSGTHIFRVRCDGPCRVIFNQNPTPFETEVAVTSTGGLTFTDSSGHFERYLIAGASYFVAIEYRGNGYPALGMLLPNAQKVEPIPAEYFMSGMRTLAAPPTFATTSGGRCVRTDTTVDIIGTSISCFVRCSAGGHGSCANLYSGEGADDQVACGYRWEMEAECARNRHCSGFDILDQADGGFVKAVFHSVRCNEETLPPKAENSEIYSWNAANWDGGEFNQGDGQMVLLWASTTQNLCYYKAKHSTDNVDQYCGIIFKLSSATEDVGDCYAVTDCTRMDNFVDASDGNYLGQVGHGAYYMFFKGCSFAPDCARRNRAGCHSSLAGPLCGLCVDGSESEIAGPSNSRCSAALESAIFSDVSAGAKSGGYVSLTRAGDVDGAIWVRLFYKEEVELSHFKMDNTGDYTGAFEIMWPSGHTQTFSSSDSANLAFPTATYFQLDSPQTTTQLTMRIPADSLANTEVVNFANIRFFGRPTVGTGNVWYNETQAAQPVPSVTTNNPHNLTQALRIDFEDVRTLHEVGQLRLNVAAYGNDHSGAAWASSVGTYALQVSRVTPPMGENEVPVQFTPSTSFEEHGPLIVFDVASLLNEQVNEFMYVEFEISWSDIASSQLLSLGWSDTDPDTPLESLVLDAPGSVGVDDWPTLTIALDNPYLTFASQRCGGTQPMDMSSHPASCANRCYGQAEGAVLHAGCARFLDAGRLELDPPHEVNGGTFGGHDANLMLCVSGPTCQSICDGMDTCYAVLEDNRDGGNRCYLFTQEGCGATEDFVESVCEDSPAPWRDDHDYLCEAWEDHACEYSTTHVGLPPGNWTLFPLYTYEESLILYRNCPVACNICNEVATFDTYLKDWPSRLSPQGYPTWLFPDSDAQSVRKYLSLGCEVTVSGSDAGIFAGKYGRYDDSTFLNENNASRLQWISGGGDDTCDGWSLDQNINAEVDLAGQGCEDNNVAANKYLAGYDRRFWNSGCLVAFSLGLCDDDIVRGLCARSCNPFTEQQIGGHVLQTQDTGVGLNSSCLGDNNMAAYALRQNFQSGAVTPLLSPPTTTVPDTQSCMAWTETWYNATHSMCHVDGVVLQLHGLSSGASMSTTLRDHAAHLAVDGIDSRSPATIETFGCYTEINYEDCVSRYEKRDGWQSECVFVGSHLNVLSSSGEDDSYQTVCEPRIWALANNVEIVNGNSIADPTAVSSCAITEPEVAPWLRIDFPQAQDVYSVTVSIPDSMRIHSLEIWVTAADVPELDQWYPNPAVQAPQLVQDNKVALCRGGVFLDAGDGVELQCGSYVQTKDGREFRSNILRGEAIWFVSKSDPTDVSWPKETPLGVCDVKVWSPTPTGSTVQALCKETCPQIERPVEQNIITDVDESTPFRRLQSRAPIITRPVTVDTVRPQLIHYETPDRICDSVDLYFDESVQLDTGSLIVQDCSENDANVCETADPILRQNDFTLINNGQGISVQVSRQLVRIRADDTHNGGLWKANKLYRLSVSNEDGTEGRGGITDLARNPMSSSIDFEFTLPGDCHENGADDCHDVEQPEFTLVSPSVLDGGNLVVNRRTVVVIEVSERITTNSGWTVTLKENCESITECASGQVLDTLSALSAGSKFKIVNQREKSLIIVHPDFWSCTRGQTRDWNGVSYGPYYYIPNTCYYSVELASGSFSDFQCQNTPLTAYHFQRRVDENSEDYVELSPSVVATEFNFHSMYNGAPAHPIVTIYLDDGVKVATSQTAGGTDFNMAFAPYDGGNLCQSGGTHCYPDSDGYCQGGSYDSACNYNTAGVNSVDYTAYDTYWHDCNAQLAIESNQFISRDSTCNPASTFSDIEEYPRAVSFVVPTTATALDFAAGYSVALPTGLFVNEHCQEASALSASISGFATPAQNTDIHPIELEDTGGSAVLSNFRYSLWAHPLPGATNVPLSTTISLRFVDPVFAGVGETIRIESNDGAGDVLEMLVDSTAIRISGRDVLIVPSADLEPGMTYSVHFNQHAFTDASGNPIAHALQPGSELDYSFTTVPTAESFQHVFRSWVNGSWTEDSYGYEREQLASVCSQSTTGHMPHLEQLTSGASKWFSWAVPEDSSVHVSSVCETMSDCPRQGHCVLPWPRFEYEMQWRKSVSRDAFLSVQSQSTLDDVFGASFEPMVITSFLRMEARFTQRDWSTNQWFYRPNPTATRFKIINPGSTGDTFIFSSASPSAGEGVVALQEFGREYPTLANYQDWMTDVFRIERFAKVAAGSEQLIPMSLTALTGSHLTFEIYMPVVEQTVIVFRTKEEDTACQGASVLPRECYVDITTEGGSVTAGSDRDKYIVSVTTVNADFLVTADVLECESIELNPCSAQQICHEAVGAPPTCGCDEGEVMVDGGCLMPSGIYDSQGFKADITSATNTTTGEAANITDYDVFAGKYRVLHPLDWLVQYKYDGLAVSHGQVFQRLDGSAYLYRFPHLEEIPAPKVYAPADAQAPFNEAMMTFKQAFDAYTHATKVVNDLSNELATLQETRRLQEDTEETTEPSAEDTAGTEIPATIPDDVAGVEIPVTIPEEVVGGEIPSTIPDFSPDIMDVVEVTEVIDPAIILERIAELKFLLIDAGSELAGATARLTQAYQDALNVCTDFTGELLARPNAFVSGDVMFGIDMQAAVESYVVAALAVQQVDTKDLEAAVASLEQWAQSGESTFSSMAPHLVKEYAAILEQIFRYIIDIASVQASGCLDDPITCREFVPPSIEHDFLQNAGELVAPAMHSQWCFSTVSPDHITSQASFFDDLKLNLCHDIDDTKDSKTHWSELTNTNFVRNAVATENEDGEQVVTTHGAVLTFGFGKATEGDWYRYTLYPSQNMPFGWRVKEIRLFYNQDCTDEILDAVAWDGSKDYPNLQEPHSLCNVYDGDSTTAWWSRCVKCEQDLVQTADRIRAAWISFSTPEPVGCVRVDQVAAHAADSLVLEADATPNYKGENLNGVKGGVRSCDVSNGRTPTSSMCEDNTCFTVSDWHFDAHVDGTSSIAEVSTACGEADTKIFGEILGNLQPDGSTYLTDTGSYHSFASACQCHAACMKVRSAGCVGWSFHEETAHCHLLGSLFREGEGWYTESGQLQSGGFPGWVSGRLNTMALRWTTTPSLDTLTMGQQFSINVHGVAFPQDVSFQRIKLVEEGSARSRDEVPHYIEGLDCVYDTKTMTATVCMPNPSDVAADGSVVTWSDIKIHPATDNSRLLMYYCSGEQGCADYSSWRLVPGTMPILGNPAYTFTTSPAVVERGQDSFAMTVRRDPFRGIAEPATWSFRILRAHNPCTLEGEGAFVIASTVEQTADSVELTIEIDLLRPDQIGEWKVCINDGESSWQTVPLETSALADSDTGHSNLEIAGTEADRETLNVVFSTGQFASLASSTVPAHAKVSGRDIVLRDQTAVLLRGGGCKSGIGMVKSSFVIHLAGSSSGPLTISESCRDAVAQFDIEPEQTINSVNHPAYVYETSTSLVHFSHDLYSSSTVDTWFTEVGNAVTVSGTPPALLAGYIGTEISGINGETFTNLADFLSKWTAAFDVSSSSGGGGGGTCGAGNYGTTVSTAVIGSGVSLLMKVTSTSIYDLPTGETWSITGVASTPMGTSCADVGVRPDPLESSESHLTLTFPMDSVTAGQYELCYCDPAESQSSRAVASSQYKVSTWDIHSEQRCPGGSTAPNKDQQLCQTKRNQRCQGTGCFLDSYDLLKPGQEYNSIRDIVYCVEFDQCKDMCDDWDTCTGFNFNKEHYFCTLHTGSSCREAANRDAREVGWYHTERSPTNAIAHVPCAQMSDYQRPVGTLTATRHVTNVQYVLPPADESNNGASIEITGPDVVGRLSDRIMPIACSETCGVDEPTSRILPRPNLTNPTAYSWLAHAPVPVWRDPYDLGLIGTELYTAEDNETDPLPELVKGTYIESSGQICKGSNMIHADIEAHLCYNKCSSGDCVGADCHCEGYISGRDTPTSTAACVTLAVATQICDGIENCGSIDMHATLPRAHFNKNDCSLFTASAPYNLHVKNAPTRQSATIPVQETYEGLDFGKSWSEMLRYEVHGLEGGMLTNPEYRRKTCISQYHGGLRCYDSWQVGPLRDAALLEPTPPDADITLYEASPTPAPPAVESIAWCLYGPEELTRDIPYCQRVAPWQSLYGSYGVPAYVAPIPAPVEPIPEETTEVVEEIVIEETPIVETPVETVVSEPEVVETETPVVETPAETVVETPVTETPETVPDTTPPATN